MGKDFQNRKEFPVFRCSQSFFPQTSLPQELFAAPRHIPEAPPAGRRRPQAPAQALNALLSAPAFSRPEEGDLLRFVATGLFIPCERCTGMLHPASAALGCSIPSPAVQIPAWEPKPEGFEARQSLHPPHPRVLLGCCRVRGLFLLEGTIKQLHVGGEMTTEPRVPLWEGGTPLQPSGGGGHCGIGTFEAQTAHPEPRLLVPELLDHQGYSPTQTAPEPAQPWNVTSQVPKRSGDPRVPPLPPPPGPHARVCWRLRQG